MAATRGVGGCLRGDLGDVPSTVLWYPHSMSSSVGTRRPGECARIPLSEYDVVTRNQSLYGRGTFFRGQHGCLSAFQCSHDHPPSHAMLTHQSSRCPHTCEAARSSAVVHDGHAVCTGYGAGQYGHVRATSATVSPCLAGTAAGLEMAAAVTCADVSTIEMMADRHVFRAAVMPASRLSSTSRCAALFPT